MKLNYLTAIGCAVAVSVSTLQASIIAQWTFESSVPATAGPHPAEIGVNLGPASPSSSVHSSSSTVYSNPVGNGTAESFSANFWATGDYFQFQTSTLGYQDLTLSWEQTRSGTGPLGFKMAYSTDGSSFTDWAGYNVSVVTWSSGTYSSGVSSNFFNLSAVSLLDNQNAVYFRLIATTDPTSTAGSSRVDNFTINGDLLVVPEPSTFVAGALLAIPFGVQGIRYLRNRKRA